MSLKYADIINKMSLEEKACMLSGKNAWETVDVPKYKIPSMTMADGPHGLRRTVGDAGCLGSCDSLPATCFPPAATVANSWNEALGEEIGKALGEEAASMHVHILLGPGLNIKRSPLCGRNFEYFSEDPFLSGKMAAAYVRGIERQGVAACPKHFAANNQELRRMASNSVVDERTLRELYLTGFEIAVKEGHPRAIMSSYNAVNGVYANENGHLLTEILVGEWGFDGCVISDWGGSSDHALAVKNGSHLEMPGTGDDGPVQLVRAVGDGTLEEAELDRRLDELLGLIFSTQPPDGKREHAAYDLQEHLALAGRAAEESIVLLKNDGNILPLKKGTKVLLVGALAGHPRYQGEGSSFVHASGTPESIRDCLKADCHGLVITGYEPGYIEHAKPKKALARQAVEAAKQADVVLVFAGLWEGSEAEGEDRRNMHLPKAQNELIAALAAAGTPVVAVLSAGSPVELPWADDVKGIVHGGLGGQAGASAMLRVLTGEVCPSGKLAETYPFFYADTPAYEYYPGRERDSEYREALYVGYRYYDTVRKHVMFPFGYGLSYTTFAYDNLMIMPGGIIFDLRNTGTVDGAEIVQMYISRKSDTVFRPAKELKGFKKVFLKAGAKTVVQIPFDDKTFRFFDTRTDTWETERGEYQILIGANVEKILLTGTITRKGTVGDGRYADPVFADYFAGAVEQISDRTFQALCGTPPREERAQADGKRIGDIDINDPLSELSRSRSILGRLLYAVLWMMVKKGELWGKPDRQALFAYNMPIRGCAKLTGGRITMDMAGAFTELVNGHRIKGTVHLVKAVIRRRRR